MHHILRGEHADADEFLARFERLAEALPSLDRGTCYAVAAWRKFQTGEPVLALQLLSRAVVASEARGTPYYPPTVAVCSLFKNGSDATGRGLPIRYKSPTAAR